MAFDPPDLGRDAQALLFRTFGAAGDHDLAVALQVLPADGPGRQRVVAAADQLQRHPAQRQEIQLGRQHLLPPHDAEVRLAVQDQAADVLHHGKQQLQLDMGKAGGEIGKKRAHGRLREQFVDGDDQPILDMRLEARGDADQVDAAVQDHPRLGQQAGAGLGQHGAAARAVEKLDPEVDFQVRDLGADGGLRLAQAAPRRRERALLGGGGKGFELFNGNLHPSAFQIRANFLFA